MGHYSRFPLDADPGLQMLLPREQGSTGGPSIVGGSEYWGGGLRASFAARREVPVSSAG